ncbi:MAG: endonuclease/exonuclease/phosphatase family protein [Acidobacteriota bacterium]
MNLQGRLVMGLAAAGLVYAQTKMIERQQPELLTFEELRKLSDEAVPAGELGTKMQKLLATPVIDNSATLGGTKALRPQWPGLGPLLRVAMWNIERGQEFDLVRMAFTDPDALMAESAKRRAEVKTESKQEMSSSVLEEAKKQAGWLKEADVIVLNEVDWGMTRTEYRDVARELAKALGMNYTYGVEFIEVDKLYLGDEDIDLTDEQQEAEIRKGLLPDKEKYLGLHGSAILSRYPIQSAKIHRFRRCYDWYGKEKSEIAEIEKGRREVAEKVFLERIAREVRQGGRMAIIAEIAVDEAPGKKVTVVAAHLENKCVPKCRQEQMIDLLNQVRESDGPVILAGDLNTTGSDAAPTSVRREIAKRVKNPKFWAGQAVTWLSPVSIPKIFSMPANYFKNYQDPTAKSIPFVAPNKEAGLFSEVEKFKFRDGAVFDFRGDDARSVNGRAGKLANSDQRTMKGFKPTFTFKRDFKGLAGELRLDWIFVKGMARESDSASESYHWAPHFGAVLDELNLSVPDGISDHHPVMVDMPLNDPGRAAPTSRR